LTSETAKTRATRGLVLVPTRELAMQVAEAIHKYARGAGVGVVPIYGGASMEQQIRALQRGADIVVATPGRALDHLRRKTLTIDAEKVGAGKMPRVRQTAYIVPRAHKAAALGRLLDVENPASAIVFCRTRLEVEELTETLNAHGYRAEALHGGIVQRQRDRVMTTLR